MLGVRQSDAHMKNDELYKKSAQQPILELIRERQLKFIGHCLRMEKEEPANIYALYKSKYRTQLEDQERRISRYVTADKHLKL